MTLNKDVTYLRHILDAIKDIEESTNNILKKDFKKDKDIREANIRRIEVIGEAVKNISVKIRKKHPNVEWKDIAGMRDKLMHHYFGVNLETVWKTIKEDLPILKKQIKEILEKEN